MPDVVDPETRSRIMAAVRSTNTGPELRLRRAVHARGLRYGLHGRRLPGKPDLVFRRFGAVCFVHGCFWHRHPGCKHATMPGTRPGYWQAKFDANVARDERNRRDLLEAGWRIAVIWECALRADGAADVAARLDTWLRGDSAEFIQEAALT